MEKGRGIGIVKRTVLGSWPDANPQQARQGKRGYEHTQADSSVFKILTPTPGRTHSSRALCSSTVRRGRAVTCSREALAALVASRRGGARAVSKCQQANSTTQLDMRAHIGGHAGALASR